jgi:hypothetical protein
MDFTRFSKDQLLFKKLLFTKVPGTFCRFTTIPSVHTKHPGKNRFLAMSPLGVGAARPAEISASRRHSRPGKVRRTCVSSPRAQLRPELGLWWRWRGYAAELCGGSRGRHNSGDRAARSEQHATQGGIEDPRDKVGVVGWWWHELQPRACRWGANGGAAGLSGRRSRWAREGARCGSVL